MSTLVIHGRDDTLITPSGGFRTAELIPGANLLFVADMGHDIPQPLWPVITDAVLSHTASPAVVDEESRRATHEALAHVAGDVVHCLAAHPLPRPGEFDVIVLLVRGTLASTAAAQHTVRALTELALDEPGGFRSILNGTGTSTRVHG